jgi:hypothetical protein
MMQNLLPSRCAKSYVVEVALLLAFCALSLAQNAPAASSSASSAAADQTSSSSDTSNSLAAAARKNKAQSATHAKKVFTDDDMEVQAGPFPRLKMDGAGNDDEILAAISKYKLTHTPQQTEDAVRSWFDRYDQELAAAMKSNLDTVSLRNANLTNGYELCQQVQDYEDYAHCQSRQMSEQRGAQHDRNEISSNNNVVMRIQHAFTIIRIGLNQNGMHYEWFKVRNVGDR